MKGRILYITKHNPWSKGGGPYASYIYLIAFLSLFKDYQIDICLSSNSIPPKEFLDNTNINIIRVPRRNTVSRIFSIFTGITHRYQKIALNLINQNVYDYCIFDHSSIAGTLVNFLHSNTKSIVIHHNFERVYYQDNSSSIIMKKLFLPHVINCEKIAYAKCDINIFLTNEDQKQFEDTYGSNQKKNIVTGIFDVNPIQINPHNTLVSDGSIKLAITGSLDNLQNIDSIQFFTKYLYPLIPENVSIIVAGKNPKDDIINTLQELDRVKLIANPDSIDDILNDTSILLCPARLGSGIKIRVSDGLRNGIPVIAHTTSSRGYSEFIKLGYLYSFNTPSEFANRLFELINEIKHNKILSSDIQNAYRSICSLTNVIEKIENCIRSL